jgi:hypothetical protein
MAKLSVAKNDFSHQTTQLKNETYRMESILGGPNIFFNAF